MLKNARLELTGEMLDQVSEDISHAMERTL